MSDELADRAERQRTLYREAKENSDRVIPAMFIEDCAYCEQQAIDRRDDGFYSRFYSTVGDSDSSEFDETGLSAEMQSAIDFHSQVGDEIIKEESSTTTSVDELWERVGDGGAVVSSLPLLHYIEREDCYIHADPMRVGISHGIPLFVYKRRKTDRYVNDLFRNETTYLWLCGWILEAERFYDPEIPLRMGMLKHGGSDTVAPRFVKQAQESIIQRLLPDSLLKEKYVSEGHQPKINEIHDQVAFYPFIYDKDMFTDKFATWRRLYFNDREPEGCGHCSSCRT